MFGLCRALTVTIPTVAIIIPTCNRPKTLELCLHALQIQLPSNGEVEVLVLDDGNNEETRTLVESKFPWARWNKGPRRGPAANRNSGAKLTQAAWLIFVDDDCVPRSTFYHAYHTLIQIEGRDKMVFEGPTFAPGVQQSLLWEAPHNPYGGLLISCNFAIARNFFASLCGFDERYPVAAFEDTEFAERVRRSEGTIVFVPGAAVDHPWRRLPSAQTLARRWEARVIYALDLGAPPATILWRLPWHVLCVRRAFVFGQVFSRSNLKAGIVFFKEWLFVSFYTFGWINKWKVRPRSLFWIRETARFGSTPHFGF